MEDFRLALLSVNRMDRGQSRQNCTMIRMRPILRVDVLDIDHLPGRNPRLEKDVVQPVTEKDSTPRPADLVCGSLSMPVYFPKGIRPYRAGVLDLVRMLGRIEIAADHGRLSIRDLIHPGM